MSQAMTWYQLQQSGLVAFNTLNAHNPCSDSIASDDLATDIPSESCNDSESSTSSEQLKHLSSQPSTQQSVEQLHIFDASVENFSPNLRALAYGDGFFTTIGVFQHRPMIKSYHQSRIENHCQALKLSMTDESQRQLWDAVDGIAASIEHGIIKIILSRPEQDLTGYAYGGDSHHNNALVWIGVTQTSQIANKTATFLDQQLSSKHAIQHSHDYIFLQDPITATCLKSQLACLPKPLAGLKSLNRLDNVLAAGELRRCKDIHPEVAEGLVRDINGCWVEGVSSNVFYQLKPSSTSSDCTQWFTPPIEGSGVAGTMRQAIIDKFMQCNQAVEIRPLEDSDLGDIYSMFFCNAVRGVIPVSQLLFNDRTFELTTSIYLKAD